MPKHVACIGERLQKLWAKLGQSHGLPLKVNEGIPALPGFTFDHEEGDVLQTAFTTLMLNEGFLAKTAMHLSLAHTDEIVDKYELAVDKTFGIMADAIGRGNLTSLLQGETAHKTFQRLL